MKKLTITTFLICMTMLVPAPALAADACEVVVCMYGKLTGNSGGNECKPAERSFFSIVKRNKHGFLPGPTASLREAFLRECKSADPLIISQIISKFGRLRG